MNWRRGVALAAIQLAIATLVIVRTESDYWPAIRSERVRVRATPPPSATAEQMMEADFYPCDEGGIIDRAAAPWEILAGAANMPTTLLIGWHEPCAQPSVLDAAVEKRYGRTRSAEALILSIQCAVVLVWWLFVGGYPLARPRRWWIEPGAFITACSIPAALISLLIPVGLALQLSPAAKVLALVVVLAWLWWFGLVLWKILRPAWQLLSGFRRRVSQ